MVEEYKKKTNKVTERQ